MKVSLETTANRPSCVDQERTSLSKRIVFIVTQLNGLDALNINDLAIPDSASCQTGNTAHDCHKIKIEMTSLINLSNRIITCW